MKELEFRSVEKKDCDEDYTLLNQLTKLEDWNRDKEVCWDRFISNNYNNAIVGL